MIKKMLLIWVILFGVVQIYAQQKHALIIAIAEYPEASGWNNIHSNNDLAILKPQFERLGFTVTSLINEQATKQNILQAMEKLTKQIHPNDYVCLHFSCHGQQMEDDNQDETDGLDEALIPYDAQLMFKENIYEGNKHLRDDEIEKVLYKIRKKIGEQGSLLVTFDACHSGTAGRDEEYVEDDNAPVRGTSLIFTSDPFYVSPEVKQVKRNHLLPTTEGLSPICLISACQPFQRNFEIKIQDQYYGTLSYAFYETLKKAKNWGESCYKAILEQAQRLSGRQIPMVESTYPF